MRKLMTLAIGAAMAVGLMASPSQAYNTCNAPGPTSGGNDVATPGGTVYGGGDTSAKGFAGERSDRGYIEVDGSSSTGLRVHGATTDKAPADVSGDAQVNPNAANKVTICLSVASNTVRFPL